MTRRLLARWSFSFVLVALIAVWSLLPLYWIILTSFEVPGTEFRPPFEYLPTDISFESYAEVVGPQFRVQRAILNSLFVSSMVTVGVLILSSLSAFAIARLRFRYKIEALVLIQIAGMVPPVVVIFPTFVLMRELDLLRTLWGLILPNIAYSIPLSTWLIAAHLSGLPLELEDAAMVDGHRPLAIFWRVILPLAAPAMFSAGVLAFLGSWGEFILALTLTLGDPAVQTVPVAISTFSRQFELQWAWVSAGIVLSLLPVIALTIVFQRTVVRGLTAGALKY